MRPVVPADLVSFLAIARHKSFRRAADELGCTPSALSHALRGVEERLDLRLVNRTTRSVALTEAGERLFARVSPAFRDIDDALDDLNNFRGRPMGALRFNASRGAAQLVLLPAVARFMALHPGVKVEIVADGALVDMVAEGCDAGVRFGETIAQDMVAVPIGGRQRTAIVATPAFFEVHPKPTAPEQLKALPCIRFRFASGRLYAWEFERDGVELNIEVDGPLTLNDQELSIQAALDGLGVTFAFEDQVADLIAQGRLVRVLEDWCPYYSGFYLYYPSRRRAPAPLRAFIDFLKEEGA
ncbi:LysR family transcriptional regulator [Caulobacter sp. 602-1]|uniref:LysR family transcriptional regulator n=1 Tax=unclassified Caulobacter TaxID=2648921 RepID=UPI000F630740|nr:LysR family transcriptional regulator [Caulobacter sp. 602-1]RRN64403.1 LysR family transcriptional regulator [Caulobacter sp. 602-1]